MTDNALFSRFPELKTLLESSEFLRRIAQERSRKPSGVPPSPDLIRHLEANRCWAEDWERVRMPEDLHPRRLFDVKFFGEVEIGSFTADAVDAGDGVTLPSGIYNSVLMDCTVGDDCLVYNVGTLCRTTVDAGAALVNTTVISGRPEGSAFGNGADVAVVVEVGGREVKWFAELSLPLAVAIARDRHDLALQEAYVRFVEAYTRAAWSPRAIVAERARVSSTGRVVNSFIGPYSIVDNAVRVEASSILSCREEPVQILDSAYVNSACVQWGCRIASASQVDRSVMLEVSGTDRHGRVLHSIIGPNTNIAGGEVTASVVGPFVGFHHQALLIATFWPEGRGNIAYGANVGSNHTSKSPDQELWPGAGVFFGLGVNVKFPTNLEKAPYSIIATAVDMLPQTVEFPFSLINQPAARLDGISPAFNEITPGWVLSDQIYAVLRNEQKFAKRDRARRTILDHEVFTPATVDLMIEARRRLQQVKEPKAVYTEKDVEGLGKNYMLEESRRKAIETYSFYICTYALRGLKNRLEKVLATEPWSAVERVLGERSADFRWEHERRIITQEFPEEGVPELLSRLVRHQERIAKDVQLSKEKDDIRGSRIIPGYEDAHVLAKDDPFVREIREQSSRMAQEVHALLSLVPKM